MAISFAKAFSIHDDALLLRSQRAEVLSDNLANVDTPNYKARDLDFQAMLAGQVSQQQSALKLSETSTGHQHGGNGWVETGELMYRTPHQPSIDGNTVDAQVEQAEFMRNALEFQISFQFLNNKIKGMRDALKGE
jgi:flagellar basal-body rod protein FlgB